ENFLHFRITRDFHSDRLAGHHRRASERPEFFHELRSHTLKHNLGRGHAETENLQQITVTLQPAPVENCNLVTEGLSVRENVGGKEDRLSLGPQPEYQIAHLPPANGV